MRFSPSVVGVALGALRWDRRRRDQRGEAAERGSLKIKITKKVIFFFFFNIKGKRQSKRDGWRSLVASGSTGSSQHGQGSQEQRDWER